MFRIVMLCLACLMVPKAWSIEQLQLRIDHWASGTAIAEALSLEQLTVNLRFTEQGFALDAKADSALLPPPLNQIKALSLQCPTSKLVAQGIQCPQGQLQFQHRELGAQTVTFQLDNDNARQQTRLVISGAKLAKSTVNALITIDKQHWQAKLTSPKLDLVALMPLLQTYLELAQSQYDLQSGQADKVQLTMAGQNQQLTHVDLMASLTDLTLSNTAGDVATEQLAADIALTLSPQDQAWHWQTTVASQQGQAYIDPIFLDLTATPIAASAQGDWSKQDNSLVIRNSQLIHQGIGQATITASWHENQVKDFAMTVQQTGLPALYQHWLQPFVVGTAADNIELSGQASIDYHLQNDDYQLQVHVENASIIDSTQRYQLQGLSGDLAWTTFETPLAINATWQQAAFYQIPIGRSEIVAQVQQSAFTLLQPWQLPIFDGQLDIEQLTVDQPQAEDMTWSFAGQLSPISMIQLSAHLGWPTLYGQISGVIPKVAYQNQKIAVDGALQLNLFQGTAIIDDLRLSELFSPIPQLESNIDISGFDLETMTQTFDFGKITGTLNGQITGLRLANWQPVAFDAQFKTPRNDKVKHRISQRAVNNLTELGGGPSGVLSRGVLQFFDTFSYQQLGLGCKLSNGICQMSGVEDTEQGYYIVKAGGLPPRINVKGYTRQVDWLELLSRLKAVSEGPAPIVQ